MQTVVNLHPASIENFLKVAPSDQPIVMINLLKYLEAARYSASSTELPCTGREAYHRYKKLAMPLLKAVEAKIIWSGQVQAGVIVPEGEVWHDAFLVQYPSKEAFAHMISQPEYKRALVHRTAALEDSRLVATTQDQQSAGA